MPTMTQPQIFEMTLVEIDAEIRAHGVDPQRIGAVEQLQRLRAKAVES